MKRLGTILIISLSFICSGNLYAQNKEVEKETLTLQQAIDSAYARNEFVYVNRQQNNLLEHQVDDLEDTSSDLYKQYDYSFQKSSAQKQFLRDEIEHDIKVRYANLVYLEKEIQNTESHLELKEKGIGILQVKKSLDQTNQLEYDAALLELENLKTQKEVQLAKLESQMESFEILTNRDLKKYELEDLCEFNESEISNLDGYLNSRIDTYLKYDENMAMVLKDDLEDDTEDEDSTSYLSKKYDANKAVADVSDAKKEMKKNLLEAYSSLQELKNNILFLQQRLDFFKEREEISKVQYDLGFITEIEYEQVQIDTKDLELNIRKLINSYNEVQNMIDKPWVTQDNNSEVDTSKISKGYETEMIMQKAVQASVNAAAEVAERTVTGAMQQQQQLQQQQQPSEQQPPQQSSQQQ